MLSIIIPTYNEERFLPLLLESIKKQDYHEYEIIVADANSKDNTRKIARNYGCQVVKGGLPAKGRNNGARYARGDILLFLDADIILPQGFIRKNLDVFKKKNLVAAAVWAKPLSISVFDKALFFIANSCQNIIILFRPVASGWCILVKKSVFKKVGGFDEKLLVGEDYDLVNRTRKYGKFAMIKKKHVYVSVRRFEKEGRLKFVLKILKTTFFDIIGKKMTIHNKEVEYKFGGYSRIKIKDMPKIK